jgi:hypothetical protein
MIYQAFFNNSPTLCHFRVNKVIGQFQEYMSMKTIRTIAISALVTLLMSSHVTAGSVIDFSNVQAFAVDADTVQINNIRVDVEVPDPFGGRGQIVTVYYDVPFDFDPTTLHLVPNAAGITNANVPDANCADLQIVVSNAVDGTGIANATVSVGEQNSTTNVEGVANFSHLPTGSREVRVASDNYAGISRPVELSCGANNTVAFNLNPITGNQALAATDIRIVLNWGEHPVDLDAHLTGPEPGVAAESIHEADRFHIYWDSQTAADGVAVLDIDDVTSFGPETVTIKPPTGAAQLRPGVYRYTVYQYEGLGTLLDGASVDLYIGNSPVRQFRPQDSSGAETLLADTEGNIWTVFELNVDNTGAVTVYPIKTLTHSSAGSSGVTRRTANTNAEPVNILYAQ